MGAMHRHWWERAFAALLLLWFTVGTVEPAALHSCPVHGWPAAAPAHAPAGGAAHVADDHAAVAHHAPARPAPDHDGGHRCCTCIGDCSGAGTVTGIPSASLALVPTTTGPARVERPHAATRRVASPAALLPFATGPPRGRPVA
jgi:hypothetical protein